jgi:hypothetical protein
VLSSLEPPLRTSVASFSASGGGLSPPPLSTQSSVYSQIHTPTTAYSSSSPSHTSNAAHHLPTHQAPTHHASYRDHSDSYRSHHHSTISSQVKNINFFNNVLLYCLEIF